MARLDLRLCDLLDRSTGADSIGVGPRGRVVARASGGELYGVGEARGGSGSVDLERGRTLVRLEATTLGSEIYRESTLAVALARCVGDGAVAAFTARVLRVSADRHDGRWSLGIDAAVGRRLLGRVHILVSAENVNGPKIGETEVPRSVGTTLALKLEEILIAAGVECEAGFDASSGLSFEAGLLPGVVARAGVRTAPHVLMLGCGLGRGSEDSRLPTIDLALEWHPRLGFCTFVSVTFVFRRG